MMKRKDVVQETGLCYTTIYNLEKAGKFPARRQLSPGRVAWIRAEVSSWLSNSQAVPVVLTLLLDLSDGKLNLFGLIA
jgi:prophage regulatory protein